MVNPNINYAVIQHSGSLPYPPKASDELDNVVENPELTYYSQPNVEVKQNLTHKRLQRKGNTTNGQIVEGELCKARWADIAKLNTLTREVLPVGLQKKKGNANRNLYESSLRVKVQSNLMFENFKNLWRGNQGNEIGFETMSTNMDTTSHRTYSISVMTWTLDSKLKRG